MSLPSRQQESAFDGLPAEEPSAANDDVLRDEWGYPALEGLEAIVREREERDAASVALLEAVRHGASYRLEGSEDWGTNPGRLTVWLALKSDEWDAVYDALDGLDEDAGSMLSLPAEDRGQELLAPGGVEGVPPSAAHAPDAATRRRLIVTHTRSLTYDPAAVEKMWDLLVELELLDFVRGDEDTNEESRAMTVYEAMGDTSVELFLEVQDDDVGYEVEDYDPEA